MRWYDYRDVYGRQSGGFPGGKGAALPGTLKVAPGVLSPQLRNRRDVLVWLPPGYDGSRRLPVLYMQDGQNLFDPATSFSAHWAVAETMAQLAAAGLPAIAVGIPNAGRRRILEYSPFVDRYYGGGLGDQYLRFLADTVKPLVDDAFATRREPAATGLVGASLGGMVALYGLAERPDVFGLCAALSPSCWFARQALNRHLTGLKRTEGRFYVDVGMGEGRRRGWRPTATPAKQTRFISAVDRVAKKLSRKLSGKASGKLPTAAEDLSRGLLYLVDPRGEHNEHHWRRRLPLALRFLLSGIA